MLPDRSQPEPRHPPSAAYLLLLLVACGGTERRSNVAGDSVRTPVDSGSSPVAAVGGPWTLDAAGIGPVRVGTTLAAARAALGSTATLPAPRSRECDYVRPEGGPAGVAFMVVADTLVRIDVRDSSVTTAEGARIGDPEARIRALYGARVTARPHKYTDGRYLVVPGGSGSDTSVRLVFETDASGRVTTFRSGRMPEVEYVEGCS